MTTRLYYIGAEDYSRRVDTFSKSAHTLKQAFDQGGLIRICDRNGEAIAQGYLKDGRYFFTGLTGQHSICSSSDAPRLSAHWQGFVDACLAFAARVAAREAGDKPALCYVVIHGKKVGERIGIVRRGHLGYFATDLDAGGSDDAIAELVRHANAALGVDQLEALAMETGSMFGWHVPGARREVVAARRRAR